jgi:hypothetical protein
MQKAKETADLLIPAFDATPSGIPFSSYEYFFKL